MRSKLIRIGLGIVGVQAILAVVGRVMSKKLGRGDESSDDFQVAAIFGGKKFESHATNLRSASAIASMGGVELDLTDATLDPDGATLEVRATMGGVQITVPPEWAVDVDAETTAAGFDIDVPAAEDLPEDAPKLHVHAVAKMGGGQITTSPG